MKSPFLSQSVEIIFRELKGVISENEYTEYSAKKNENEKFTQTVFRTYDGDKISRLALEQYTVNSKAFGVVLNIYPKPEFGIPIFTFQFGGQIPDRVIFVIDIIPVISSPADPGISGIYKKHASGMNNLGSGQDWINQICTENALICQYKALEPEKVLSALTDYLVYWRDACYFKAVANVTEADQKVATGNILKFKSILHENDAGLEIYSRKFGKEMSLAIQSAAFGSVPALTGLTEPESNNNDVLEGASAVSSVVAWTPDAEQFLQEAPRFVRSKIRASAEKKALELGIKEINRAFIETLRK
jgi:hypothetical protein